MKIKAARNLLKGQGNVTSAKGVLRKALATILVLFLLPLLAVARAEAAGFVEVSYEFSEPQITQSGDYHSVNIEGLDRLGKPGLPVLPYKTAKILIPFAEEVSGLEVICAEKIELPGSYMIEPGISVTSSVISYPRLAGRQCIIFTPAGASFTNPALT